jgi:hypothetical protein
MPRDGAIIFRDLCGKLAALVLEETTESMSGGTFQLHR